MSYRPGDGPKTGSLVQVLAQIAEYARIVAGRMMPDDKAATRAAGACAATLYRWMSGNRRTRSERVTGAPIRFGDGSWYIPPHLRADVDWATVTNLAVRRHGLESVADVLQVDERTVRRWKTGRRQPHPARRWALWHLAKPWVEIHWPDSQKCPFRD